MSIYVKTDTPSELVQRIKDGINEHKIATWLCDSDGDFTHDTDQWRHHAWISPLVEEGRVVFRILCRKDKDLSVMDYAIYHGRFVEMLLVHFDNTCKDIEVTPLATKYDIIHKDK